MVDLLHPVLDEVAPTLIGFLARNLVQVLDTDPKGLETLPASLMAEVLGNPCLVICHPSFFKYQAPDRGQIGITSMLGEAGIQYLQKREST